MPDRFTRRGALPASALRLAQDKGSVATLDGKAHLQRKQMFMALMTPEGIQRLSDEMAGESTAPIMTAGSGGSGGVPAGLLPRLGRQRLQPHPPGGGDHLLNHRCAGEWVTIALMKRAVRLLTAMRYGVPAQDLRIDLSRMPALPRSGFVISQVERAPSARLSPVDESGSPV